MVSGYKSDGANTSLLPAPVEPFMRLTDSVRAKFELRESVRAKIEIRERWEEENFLGEVMIKTAQPAHVLGTTSHPRNF